MLTFDIEIQLVWTICRVDQVQHLIVFSILHDEFCKVHFCYFWLPQVSQFYVICKMKDSYWRNSMNKWDDCGWLCFASIKKKKGGYVYFWGKKIICFLPNAYLSNFLWKSKDHVPRNKENEDLTRCIRIVLHSTRTKAECHEWWAL